MSGADFALGSLGFARVAVAAPELKVADVRFNTRATLAALENAAARGCQLVLFPELGITGYTCADLFYQALLRNQALAALAEIAEATARLDLAAVIGLPIEAEGKLYNCAAFIANGAVLGLVPKTYIPTTNEYYEERWFTSARECTVESIEIGGVMVPLGVDLLFPAANMLDCIVGVEICEDLWAVVPPSSDMALAGATLLLNPSGSDEVLGKAQYRRELITQQSARCLSAYLYAGAGPGESTTDVVFSGHCVIAENGSVLAESERFHFDTQMVIADIDVQRLTQERIKNSSYSLAQPQRRFRRIPFTLRERTVALEDAHLLRPPISPAPFVPSNPEQRALHCEEIFSIQSTALAKRLRHTGIATVTLGLSGGLDSTLALLVIQRAFDALGLSHSGIVCVTMPGFGTSSRTRSNAQQLAALLGVTLREIPIRAAVKQHFKDIGHDEERHDVTYENSQARERTQILMDLANELGGLVVGTGDLSELALGWATYNGDQMSMYHVNSGVPKTLVRYLVEWATESLYSGETADVLRDICATPISPELLPPANGARGDTQHQATETTIGPYLLHDFFLFYAVRYAFAPRKIFFLAHLAFVGQYSDQEILRWLRVFYDRFFANQFKRSAMPDGPKVGSVALSPRGDWRMPSDASNALWRRELDEIATSIAPATQVVRG